MENDVSYNAVQKGMAAGLKDWDTLSVSERTSGGGQFLSYVKALLCHTFFVVVLFLHHVLCLSNVPNMEKIL